MNVRHARRVLTYIGKAKSLTESLEASIAMMEKGEPVPRHRLPTDHELAVTHSELEKLLRPRVWVVTNEDIKQEFERITK